MIKVIIAGSRSFKDYGTLKRVCNNILSLRKDVEIVSGGAKGADYLGEVYAKEVGFNIKRFPANWEEYGKSAGYIRNEEMAKYADALIAFWDGKSKGTEHMINLAKKHNLKLRIYQYENNNEV